MDKTYLKDLIEKVNADDLPTSIFTIEDKDPLVILGKMNEIISNLENIKFTIDESDKKAQQALDKAIESLKLATSAITGSNNALDTANKAIDTANRALNEVNLSVELATNAKQIASNANTTAIDAKELANNATTTANDAKELAENATTTANGATTTANDAKELANNATTTANDATTTANDAKELANNANTTAIDANGKANNAVLTSTTAINKSDKALTESESAKQIAQDALDKVISGSGTTIYDNDGNKLKDAKLESGENINVNFISGVPNKFAFNLDSNVMQKIETKVNQSDLINIIYPIGSVLAFANGTNPNNIWLNTTWEKIEDAFLYGVKDANELDKILGSNKHKLTIDEMPIHTHEQYPHTHTQLAHTHTISGYSGDERIASAYRPRSDGYVVFNYGNSRRYENSLSQLIELNKVSTPIEKTTPIIKNTGGGLAFDIMPKHYGVNLWKRTN